MGRLPRPVADGLVYHALNRGNNRAAVFDGPADYALFLKALRQTRQRYPFRLFGYCLMPNHFHLLLRPDDGQNISRILQSLTVAHTWHFHQAQHSSGHVWQGRFKSPVIQDDDHLLTVLRYIEANPLRAGLVRDLADYRWSSYAAHGLGQADDLLSDVPVWARLGQTEAARRGRWRAWVHEPLGERELAAVRKSVTSGRPYGSPAWVEGIARRLAINLSPRPRGRPRKQAEKMN
jgi:putative transposase